MSDDRPETPDPTAPGPPDAGRGVYAGQGAGLRDMDQVRPSGNKTWRFVRRSDIFPRIYDDAEIEITPVPDRGRIELDMIRPDECEPVALTPADAILIGRALVEMGEEMKAAKEVAG